MTQLECLSSGVATSGDGVQSGMKMSELVEGSLSDSSYLVSHIELELIKMSTNDCSIS